MSIIFLARTSKYFYTKEELNKGIIIVNINNSIIRNKYNNYKNKGLCRFSFRLYGSNGSFYFLSNFLFF
jgi:hypothetical protein